MTPFNFAVVAFRLMGIYLILGTGAMFAAFGLIGTFLMQLILMQMSGIAETKNSAILFVPLMAVALQVAMGVILIVFSRPLARKIIPSIEEDSEKTVWSLGEIEVLAFAAVGLLILASAFPNIGRAWHNIYLWCADEEGNAAARGQAVQSLLYSMGVCAQIVLGLFLILNSQGFRNIWHKLRTAGTYPKE